PETEAEPDQECGAPRGRSSQAEHPAAIARDARDPVDDRRDDRVLNEAPDRGRPLVEEILGRLARGEANRVAQRREREHEAAPECQWPPHRIAAVASGTGVGANHMPAVAPASRSAPSSPT